MSRRHSSVTTIARRPRNPKRAMNKVQSLRAQLADHLISEDLVGAVDVLRGTLKATKHQAVSKFSTIEVPDHTARVAAAKLILEYAVGKPSQVVELPDEDGAEGQVKNATPYEVVSRLKQSGLNLLDIVDAYDAESEDEDEDDLDQRAEDERVARSFD